MTPQEMVVVLVQGGFTEGQIASLCDVSQPTIHRIKAGKVKNPGWRAVQGIQSLYETHIVCSDQKRPH